MSAKDYKYPLDPVLYKKGWVLGFRCADGSTCMVGRPIYGVSEARRVFVARLRDSQHYFLYEIHKAGAWYRILRIITAVSQFDRLHSAPEAARSAAASGARQNERGEG